MFTGIIEFTGEIVATRPVADGVRLHVRPARPIADLAVGESIAISGTCLTVELGSSASELEFFASPETLNRTTLGSLRRGALVNLERALRADTRLGGHMVSGHVDGLGRITRWQQLGESWELEVEFPAELAAMIAVKGSVAVDGISLTVAALDQQRFTVAVIPHTVAQTSLRTAAVGQQVNLEVDMLARYVLRACEVLASRNGGLTRDMLARAGFG